MVVAVFFAVASAQDECERKNCEDFGNKPFCVEFDDGHTETFMNVCELGRYSCMHKGSMNTSLRNMFLVHLYRFYFRSHNQARRSMLIGCSKK